MSVTVTPGRFAATNIDLQNLITVAYRLPWFRIINLPSWASERYDIVATMPTDADASQLGLMLRSLLAERFMMRAHMETREQPVYALAMARSDGRLGPQLRRSVVDCAAAMAARVPLTGTPSRELEVTGCDDQIRTSGQVTIRGLSIDVLGRPAIAQLSGRKPTSHTFETIVTEL